MSTKTTRYAIGPEAGVRLAQALGFDDADIAAHITGITIHCDAHNPSVVRATIEWMPGAEHVAAVAEVLDELVEP